MDTSTDDGSRSSARSRRVSAIIHGFTPRKTKSAPDTAFLFASASSSSEVTVAVARSLLRRCAEAVEFVVARTVMPASAVRIPWIRAVPMLPVPMEAIVVKARHPFDVWGVVVGGCPRIRACSCEVGWMDSRRHGRRGVSSRRRFFRTARACARRCECGCGSSAGEHPRRGRGAHGRRRWSRRASSRGTTACGRNGC